MRRAAAFVLGTMTGTSLLVGAKLATHSPNGTTATADDNGVTAVIVGKPGAPGNKSPGVPHGSATPTGTAVPTGSPAPTGTGTHTAGGTPTSTPTSHGGSTPSPTKTTAKPTPTPTPTPTGLTDGTYTASAPVGNSGGHGTLSMTVTISGHQITAIAASETGGETNCYHNACLTLKPEALAAQSANINSVSNATQTSNAFKAALQAILNSA